MAAHNMDAFPAYVVITPVRDEADLIQQTVDSMVEQTCRPSLWIIVDDGSTDATGAIIDRAAARHEWIKVIHRVNRGFRKSGGGVVEAFYEGFHQAQNRSWDFLVKLDGDLSFEKNYFELCLNMFNLEPKLGIGGGTVCQLVNGQPVIDSKGDPAFHVRGATKIYRKNCWLEIGGLFEAPGWDTIDEIKANMCGWITRTFPEINIIQNKKTGAGDGAWKNYVKNGVANYVTGYHPLFMFLKCVMRSVRRPYLMMGLGLGVGFIKGLLYHIPRVDDPAMIQYLRRQQMNALLFKKSFWSQ